MNIIEQYTMSKTGNLLDNEDCIFTNEHYIAVVDGVTSKSKHRFNNLTGGRLSSIVISDVLNHLRGDEDCNTVFFKLQHGLSTYTREHNLSNLGIRLCASIIIYSNFYHQLWIMGDCQYKLDDKFFSNRKEIDSVTANARAVVINCLLKQGVTEEDLFKNDLGREAIMPILKLQHFLENTDGAFGFSCLNAAELEENSQNIERFYDRISKVDVQPGVEITLATDGYPALLSNLDESETYLKKVICEDPLCYKTYRSTKGIAKENVSFDDRAYIRFRI